MIEDNASVIETRDFGSFSDVVDLHSAAYNVDVECEQISDNGKIHNTPTYSVGLVLLYASWCQPIKGRLKNRDYRKSTLLGLRSLAFQLTAGIDECHLFVSEVEIDASDDSLTAFIGDGQSKGRHPNAPLPPTEFPCLALVLQQSSTNRSDVRYFTGVSPHFLLPSILEWANDDYDAASSSSSQQSHFHTSSLWVSARKAMEKLEIDYHLPVQACACDSALRIFVSGDHSSVGKSSTCLGLLGSLLRSGSYHSNEIAYIKPATQSESKQLIELWCEQQDIACIPVGPLVYYRGFTRAYLAGETPFTTSEEWLEVCARAVDRLARGKKLVLVDGVGFPAVGSICGTDNAHVARACGAPVSHKQQKRNRRAPMGVVLVGRPGVGAAVDAFNLNTAFFEKYQVPVLGAIFNKLEMDGYYSLENCRREITLYFKRDPLQRQHGRHAFGFVPLFSAVSGVNGLSYVEAFIDVFMHHVDVEAIIEAAHQVQNVLVDTADQSVSALPSPLSKKMNTNEPSLPVSLPVIAGSVRSRREIELAAISNGAAPSA